MNLFLKHFLLAGLFYALLMVTPPPATAQYFVPQDKKTTSPGPTIFKRPPPIVTYNESRPKTGNDKPATLAQIFPLDEFAALEGVLERIPPGNTLATPVYNPNFGADPVQAQIGDCTAQQQNAIRAIQKYNVRKSEGLLPTAGDKKVAVFMAVPSNAGKAQALADQCGMGLQP